jgi:hypothetical protein
MLLGEAGGPHPVSWDKVAALADLCDAPDAVVDCCSRTLAKRDDTNAMLEAAFARRA